MASFLLSSPLLPTSAGEEPLAGALLEVSEVLPSPGGSTPEAEGEWVELLVTRSGDVGGITLSDLDGEPDFVFPPGRFEAGTLLVVANGHTRPPAAGADATVFLAMKDWWTLDNEGDDAALLSPSGEVLDLLAYGQGRALDAPPEAVPDGLALIPKGASFGRVPGGSAALMPTPGGANLPLGKAADGRFGLRGAVSGEGLVEVVLCRSGGAALPLHLWTAEVETRRAGLPSLPVDAGACIAVGSLQGPALAWVEERIGASPTWVDLRLPADPPDRAALRVKDPWGSTSIEVDLPALLGGAGRLMEWMEPCACAAGWQRVPIAPGPLASEGHLASGVRLVQAGPPLAAEVSAFMRSAAFTLDVNAYLVTSHDVVAELRAAAARGVRVRMLLEGAPAGIARNATAMDERTVAELADAGIDLRTFNASQGRPERDHAKYAVADAEQVMVLTENFVGAALGAGPGNTGFGLLLSSPGIAGELMEVFEWDFEDGVRQGAHAGAIPTPRQVAPGPPSGDSTASVLLSPLIGGTASEWVREADEAKRSLVIASLSADRETLGAGGPVGAALLRAAARGVDVRVLLGHDGAPEAPGGASAAAFELASAASGLAGALDVRFDPRPAGGGTTMHAKALVADGERLILGSHNLVAAAFSQNREVSLRVESPAAAAALEAALLRVFELAVPAAGGTVSVSEGDVLGDVAGSFPDAQLPPTLYSFLFVLGSAVVVAAESSPLRRRARRALLRPLLRAARGRRRPPVSPRAAPGEAEDGPPMEAAPGAPAGASERGPFALRVEPHGRAREPSPAGALPPTALDLLKER